MIEEYKFILKSKYGDLFQSLNGFYTMKKLTNEEIDPLYVKFHDQAVENDWGWNIFIGRSKFNLGYNGTEHNKLILYFWDMKYDDFSSVVENFIEKYNLNFEMSTQISSENIIVLTIHLNLEITEEIKDALIDLIDLSESNVQ